MKNDTANLPETDRIRALSRERVHILSLPPGKALDRILDHPSPAGLVHSFPEEDFYFLIHDIGLEDALPLLALASYRQLDYILDLELWEKDRLDLSAATQWFGAMLSADATRFLEWLKQEKAELLEFYLFHNLEVRIREHDQDPSDFGDDFTTFDDVYYFRILPETAFPESDDKDTVGGFGEEFRREQIRKILTGLADMDHAGLQNLLLESLTILPAETEEEAYRWRNVRLAEKGFLPFDEAVGIYQPMDPDDLVGNSTAMNSTRFPRGFHGPAPLTPFNLLKESNIFSEAIANVTLDDRIYKIQEEFAFLCNQIIVADQKSVKSKEDLYAVVKKVCGYINIALEFLSREKSDGHPESGKQLLTYPLAHIFKVGYGRALSLKWDAKRWVKRSWFSSLDLRISFWGEEWMGVLGGLLIKKPLFFDDYRTGNLYREFLSLDDIQKTREILNNIMACDKLLSRTALNIKPLLPHGHLTYKNLLLTCWAGRYLGIHPYPEPLSKDEFRGFFADLWEPGTKPRKIKTSMKSDFLQFLSAETGWPALEISRLAGEVLEDIFKTLENEYGEVSPENPDPRFILHFLLKS